MAAGRECDDSCLVAIVLIQKAAANKMLPVTSECKVETQKDKFKMEWTNNMITDCESPHSTGLHMIHMFANFGALLMQTRFSQLLARLHETSWKLG